MCHHMTVIHDAHNIMQPSRDCACHLAENPPVVREKGSLTKCFDEFVEGVTISDELRKLLLMEDSDNYYVGKLRNVTPMNALMPIATHTNAVIYHFAA